MTLIMDEVGNAWDASGPDDILGESRTSTPKRRLSYVLTKIAYS